MKRKETIEKDLTKILSRWGILCVWDKPQQGRLGVLTPTKSLAISLRDYIIKNFSRE
jgi:hypothetical protein